MSKTRLFSSSSFFFFKHWKNEQDTQCREKKQQQQPKKKSAAQELTFGEVIAYNESHTTLIGSDGSSTYNIAHKGLSLKIK